MNPVELLWFNSLYFSRKCENLSKGKIENTFHDFWCNLKILAYCYDDTHVMNFG